MKNWIYPAIFWGLGLSLAAQPAWQNAGNNIAMVVMGSKAVVCNDTLFVAFENGTNGQAELRKLDGNTWQTVGSFATLNGKFDLEVDSDGNPILATVSSTDINGTLHFTATLRKYQNGALGVMDVVDLPNSPAGNNSVDIFDFAVNPIGGYGIIFRYNQHYSSSYRAKTGTNNWHPGTAVLSPSGNSGIKDAQLIYAADGSAYILSRNASAFGGPVDNLVVHRYPHSLSSSTPQSEDPSTIFATAIQAQFSLAAYGDSIFATLGYADGTDRILMRLYVNQSSTFSTDIVRNFSLDFIGEKLIKGSNNDWYMGYLDLSGTSPDGFVMHMDATFGNDSIIGTSFNDAGQMAGQYALALNGTTPYVFFTYGPPFNNARARKYACTPAPAFTFNSSTGIISSSASFAAGTGFQWINCSDNSGISGENSSTFTPAITGSYAVEISTGGCVDTSACVNATVADLSVGIENLQTWQLLTNSGTQQIALSGVPQGAQWQIISIDGRILRSGSYSGEQLSMSSVANGVYIFRWSEGGAIESRRFIWAH